MNSPGSTLTDGEVAGFWLAGVAATGLGVAWVAVELRAVVGGPASPGGPLEVVRATVEGRYRWDAPTVVIAATLAGLVIAAAVWVATALGRRRRRDLVGDRARRLARSESLSRYIGQAPAHLGPTPGPVIGRLLLDPRRTVRATWEDEIIEIAGSRTGKTTCRAIPAILGAPGPVLATSNKRDLVDATRLSRDQAGPVWLFDPQRVAGGRPRWWWDPLASLDGQQAARRLAGIWCGLSREQGSRPDGFFDPSAEQLLGALLWAAACDRRPLTDVYRWLVDPDSDAPRDVLAGAGHPELSKGVEAHQDSPERQRAGVYATALKAVAWLADPRLARWVTDPGGKRPRFDPRTFTTGTVYALSRDPGQAGNDGVPPLVTALTAQILEGAEARAARRPAGRLPVPLLGVLDEAANICPWRALPDLVSHYGSRGIVLMTFLQSWAQGEAAWGEHGMAKLWGACNVRVYGGGNDEVAFLERLSKLCGDHDVATRSTTIGRQGRHTTLATRKEPVFDVATLAAIPRHQALVCPSGTRPVFVRSTPWYQGPDRARVEASIARYGPSAAAVQVEGRR